MSKPLTELEANLTHAEDDALTAQIEKHAANVAWLTAIRHIRRQTMIGASITPEDYATLTRAELEYATKCVVENAKMALVRVLADSYASAFADAFAPAGPKTP